MNSKTLRRGALATALAAMALTGATAAEARSCKRLNKTEGAAVGAVAGGVLGGAAIGGVGGHEIARTKYNKHCRRYYRR